MYSPFVLYTTSTLYLKIYNKTYIADSYVSAFVQL